MNLIDFIHVSNKSTNKNELYKQFIGFLHTFELDSFMMSELSLCSIAKNEEKSRILANYPDLLPEHRVTDYYFNFDPVYHKALCTMKPFTWEDILKEGGQIKSIRLPARVKEFKLCCGVGIPLYQPRGRIIGIGLHSSRNRFRSSKDNLSLLYSGAIQFFTAYSSLADYTPYNRPGCTINITDREKEVLHLVARGKTKAEIADSMCVTLSCIKRHCEKIFLKLNVHKLTQAVAKAIILNLINL